MTDSKVIPFPLSATRKREPEEPELLMYAPIAEDAPDRMALDAVARMIDGMARLQVLGETHMPELLGLSSLDQALSQIDMDVRRLRVKLERQRRRAYAIF